jgi:hypothetical protein
MRGELFSGTTSHKHIGVGGIAEGKAPQGICGA